jgi:hypothetical protein
MFAYFCFRLPVQEEAWQVIFSVNPCSRSSTLLRIVPGECGLSGQSPWLIGFDI